MLNELQHLRPLNAGDRNRTGTVSLQQDFKSCASASSATPAYMIMGRGGFEPPKQVAADLQSVPFGHSGICPFLSAQPHNSQIHDHFLFFSFYNVRNLCKARRYPHYSFRCGNGSSPFLLPPVPSDCGNLLFHQKTAPPSSKPDASA